ncbi:hypothetical protein EWM64_g2206 [Hericium alpestre]|uniref:F-box domain-containing protein n=1 Tax=Hericium alpestre TaxID=135208 RepID=A0A4Z0A621_9AGAM|nr:hypothetical protein EWM64_g2206 [Hericium alpestre]
MLPYAHCSHIQVILNARLAGIDNVTVHSPVDTVRDALDLLDEEMTTLHKVLASVAARRNTISQNFRLPPEILSRIFRSVADFHLATDNYSYPNVGKRRQWAGWMELMHVCRRWRDVASWDSHLWTDITYTASVPWLKNILSRTQAAPITLHRHVTGNARRELKIINQHLPHIKELVLILENEKAFHEMYEMLSPYGFLLSNSALLLESVTFATYRIGEKPADRGLVTDLPNELFTGTVPALRRITLHGFSLDWTLSPLLNEQITHFTLSFPRQPMTYTATEEDPPAPAPLREPRRGTLLSALARMPSLEALELDTCWPETVELDPWTQQVVEFDRMCKLRLMGSHQDCADFLEHVRIPQSAALSITCSLSGLKVAELDAEAGLPIVSAIHARIKDVSSTSQVTAMSFHISACNTILRMQLWRTPIDTRAQEDTPFLSVDFVWNSRLSGTIKFRLLERICRELQLLGLRDLAVFAHECVFYPGSLTGKRFMQLFGRFASVDQLVINGPMVRIFTQVLSLPSDDSQDEVEAPATILDTLATLSVVRFDMDCRSGIRFAISYVQRVFTPLIKWKQEKGCLQTVYVEERDVRDWEFALGDVVAVKPHPRRVIYLSRD